MHNLIKGNEEGVFALTNNAVNNIKQDEKFNQNFLAKRLYEQCEIYQLIVNNLL